MMHDIESVGIVGQPFDSEGLLGSINGVATHGETYSTVEKATYVAS